MNTDHKMRNMGTLIVLVHMAALLGHAASHAHLTIGMNTWQSAFIAIVIFAAPLFAMICSGCTSKGLACSCLGPQWLDH